MDLLTLVIRRYAYMPCCHVCPHLHPPSPALPPLPPWPLSPPPWQHWHFGRDGTDVIEEQPEKAYSLMLVRPAGSSIDVNEEPFGAARVAQA